MIIRKCGHRHKPNWWCSREFGHDGPCAMHPVGFWHRMYWRIRLRTWSV